MKLRVLVVLIGLIVLFIALSNFAQAGCCVWVDENQSTPGQEISLYSSTAIDQTCNDVLTLQECDSLAPGAFQYLDESCSDVSACGCCACEGGQSFFGLGNIYTSENFCNSFCAPKSSDIIPFVPASQCNAAAIKSIISGTVYDRFQNPVPDASVSETRGGIAKTDSNGEYTLALLQDKTEVTAEKNGITGKINVDTSLKTIGWDITLNIGITTAIVGGRVLGKGTSIPVDRAEVVLTDKADPSNVYYTTTNLSGGFEFFSIPLNKEYTIKITTCGIKDYSQNLQVNSDLIMDYFAELPPREIVQGVVESTQGVPLEDAEIILVNSKGSNSLKTSTSGSYVFNDVEANCDYSISAQYAGYKPQTKTLQVSHTDLVSTNTVNFVLEKISGVDFCTTVGWCTGPDLLAGTSDDCNVCGVGEVCDQPSRFCVASTTKECCEYDFLCPASSRISDPVCGGQGLFGCATSCKQVDACPVNVELSTFNVGDPFVCSCSGQDVSVSTSLGIQYRGGKYCCPASSQVISDVPCQYRNFAVLKGRVTDSSGNNLTAAVKVDEKYSYRSYVSYSNSLDGGNYEIYLDPSLDHEIEFVKPPLMSRKFFYGRRGLTSGQVYKLDVVLDVSTLACQYPNSEPVPELKVEHLKCENAAQFSWDDTYCGAGIEPDHFVIKDEVNNLEYFVQGDNYKIDDLEWDTSYEFSIRAVFNDGFHVWESNKTYLTSPFNPGTAICSSACASNYEVCDVNVRSTCDDNNQLIPIEDCSLSSGNWYCAGEERTKCLNDVQCGSFSSKIPFLGLFFNDRICSGFSLEKGCYLDKSDVSVDYCFNCPKPGDSEFSCFTYDSRFACENNRCGVKESCSWISNDLGDDINGYCVPEENLEVIKREQDLSSVESRCELCSAGGSLFKNTECSQYLCSGLGACELQEKQGISSCESCSASACSDYANENSCVNSTGKNLNAILTLQQKQYSDDACGLGVCAWNGTACFKDVNNDLTPDCEKRGVIQRSCEQDTIAPETNPPSGLILLNNDSGSPQNVLQFTLSEDISEFNYCLGKNDCTNFKSIDGSNSKYVSNKIVKLNPILEYQNIIDSSGSYLLKFYSVDRNFNVEEVKKATVFIDAQAPTISVFYNDECINCNSPIDCSNGLYYESSISIMIAADEAVDCSSAFIPPGEDRSTTRFKESFSASLLQQKMLEYPQSGGLNDGEYLFLIECTDKSGNRVENREIMRINSYDLIQSTSPRGSIKESTIALSSSTSKASRCEVSFDGSKLEVMDLNQVTGNYEKQVNAVPNSGHDYGVLCTLVQGSQCDYEISGFAVDFKSPEIEVELEGEIYVDDGWLHSYSQPTNVIFKINDPNFVGSEYKYGVKEFVYCIDYTGRRCDPRGASGVHIVPNGNVKIPINTEQSICYFASDRGNNVAQTACGKIISGNLPKVIIESPNTTHVTVQPLITVEGNYDVNATECIVSVENGTNKYDYSCSLDPSKKEFLSTATLLSPGQNKVVAQIREASGLFGEDYVDVYYDKIGPELELYGSASFEYGEKFKLIIDARDAEFTKLITKDDYGLVSQVSAIIVDRSSGPISGYQYNLVKKNKLWEVEIIPKLSSAGIYDLYPGEYVVDLIGIDVFGNQNLVPKNFTIVDSSPTEIKINVIPSARDKNVFYTKNIEPVIYVNTTTPSDCSVAILSKSLNFDFENINDFQHKWDSNIYLNFVKGVSQRFDAEIICKHQFVPGSEEHSLITIYYDDLPPKVEFNVDEGVPSSFKQGSVFMIDEEVQSQFKATIHAKDISDEKIVCNYDCVKDGSQECGQLPSFKEGLMQDEAGGQFVSFVYSDQKHSSGEYTYSIVCEDFTGNVAPAKEVTVFVNDPKEEFRIIETGPSVVNTLTPELYVKTNYPAECKWDKLFFSQALKDTTSGHSKHYLHKEYFYILPLPSLVDGGSYDLPITCERLGNADSSSLRYIFTVNTSAGSLPTIIPTKPGAQSSIPLIINNIDILTGLDNQGSYEVERGFRTQSYRVIDGLENNEVYVKLIASTNKKAQCRYDTNKVPYSSMSREFIDGYLFYPQSPNILFGENTNNTIYVACSDGYGGVSNEYEVNIEVNADAEIEIINSKPSGIMNSRSIIVEAETYRNLRCVYDDNFAKNNVMNKELINGRWHHTSLGKKFITVLEGADYNFKLRCGTLFGPSKEIDLNFSVDATPPVLNLFTPIPGQMFQETKIDVTGTVNEPSEVLVKVNGNVVSRMDVNGSFDDLVFLNRKGDNEIIVEAIDFAKNKVVKIVTVKGINDWVAVESIYPSGGIVGPPPRITAKISGSNFNQIATTFEVEKNGQLLVGNIHYDSFNKLLSFTPQLGYFESGDYKVIVSPYDLSNNEGYGRSAYFTVDDEAPTIIWVEPSMEDASSTDEKLNAVLDIISNSIQNPVLTATISSPIETSPLFFRNNRYVGVVDADEGKNEISVTASTASKTSSTTRIINIDREGPLGDVEPKGVVYKTRPDIYVSYDEEVLLLNISLVNPSNIKKKYALNLVSSSQKNFNFSVLDQLLVGNYLATINVKDMKDNIGTTQQLFSVSVGDVDLWLKNPKFEVASQQTIDLVFESNQDAVCAYSERYSPTLYNSLEDFKGDFDLTGRTRHLESSYKIKRQDPLTSKFFVMCRGSSQRDKLFEFDLSYDTSPPEILFLEVDPEILAEHPLTSKLYVETDDNTRCKYSCDGVLSFTQMFNTMDIDYTTIHEVNLNLQDLQTYTCNVACKNKAEMLTTPASVDIIVNTSMEPGIKILSPEDGGIYSDDRVLLKFISQKTGQCSYSIDGSSMIPFAALGRKFNETITNLSSDNHTININCVFVQGSVTEDINFVVDLTEPENVQIDDGYEACSADNLNVVFSADDFESGIDYYEYAIRSSNSTTYDILDFTKADDASISSAPVTLDAGRYYFAVMATNKAGMKSLIAEDFDGVYVDPLLEICVETNPPTAEILTEELTGVTNIELICNDDTGCSADQLYGYVGLLETCVPVSTYTEKIEVRESGLFCYRVEDLAGNSASGELSISVLSEGIKKCSNDLDCDGVIDSEDDDQDGDGLKNWLDPDDDNDDSFDYDVAKSINVDTDDDNDGILDKDEIDTNNDLDNDGLSNGEDADDDGDNIPDCEDRDDDNDGLFDNEDTDDDNDGISDISDLDNGGVEAHDDNNDLDDDGIPNYQDSDIDNDGIPNEQDDDLDNDGVPNCIDQDNDNDGISNSKDPDNSEDADQDGMPNFWEDKFSLNKFDPSDASADNDGDGLTNLEEFKLGTNPLLEDTDGDGTSDYDELRSFSEVFDPLNAEDKPKSSFSMFLTILFIIGSLIAGGYYGYQYITRPEPVAPSKPEKVVSPYLKPSTRYEQNLMSKIEELHNLRETRRAHKKELRKKIFEGDVKKDEEIMQKRAEDVFKELEKFEGKSSKIDKFLARAASTKDEFDRLAELTGIPVKKGEPQKKKVTKKKSKRKKIKSGIRKLERAGSKRKRFEL